MAPELTMDVQLSGKASRPPLATSAVCESCGCGGRVPRRQEDAPTMTHNLKNGPG